MGQPEHAALFTLFGLVTIGYMVEAYFALWASRRGVVVGAAVVVAAVASMLVVVAAIVVVAAVAVVVVVVVAASSLRLRPVGDAELLPAP